MKNVELIIPDIDDLWFRRDCMADPKTMNYNAGYEVSFSGYHYDSGCIDFPESEWKNWLAKKFSDPNFYYAYIKDIDTNTFVGYLNYHMDSNNKFMMGIVIKSDYQRQGYMKPAMHQLIQKAKQNNIPALYNTVPLSRARALKGFFDVGFEIVGEGNSKKFGKDEPYYEIMLNLK